MSVISLLSKQLNNVLNNNTKNVIISMSEKFNVPYKDLLEIWNKINPDFSFKFNYYTEKKLLFIDDDEPQKKVLVIEDEEEPQKKVLVIEDEEEPQKKVLVIEDEEEPQKKKLKIVIE